MIKTTRRKLLKTLAGAGAGLLAARSLSTGLPTSFLAYGQTGQIGSVRPTGLILVTGSAGDPLNTNCPGTYAPPGDPNHFLNAVGHATVAELGDQVFGEMNGQTLTAAGFENPELMRLGGNESYAAQPWTLLPEALRERMCFFHHMTGSGIHGILNKTLTLQGALRVGERNGTEFLPSYIAQEIGGALGSTLSAPIAFASNIKFKGSPVRTSSPEGIRTIFGSGSNTVQGVELRNDTLNRIYETVKNSGTHAQREYLDSRVRSEQEARVLTDVIADALINVPSENTVESQIEAAVSLLRVKATPVVTVQMRFGGDNHHDYDLYQEVTGNIQGIREVQRIWDTLVAQGVENDVTVAFINVFGRPLKRQPGKGRGHNSNHHVTLMFGPNVNPGVVGGLDPDNVDHALIPGIERPETLTSMAKTLSHVVGVPEEVADRRIASGKVIEPT